MPLENNIDVTWIQLVGSVLMLIGVVLVFEGRRVVRKYFDFGEENLATQGIKIFGFILATIGGFMMF